MSGGGAADSSPFEGLRVLDLSGSAGGAFAARLFADFGADVVLAEPAEGHPLRHEPPFLGDQPGLERGVLHAYLNWNKRSIVWREPSELAGLVAQADVVVTTDGAPAESPLAVALRRRRADAVHLSVTPHGLSGTLAGRAGNNLTTSARTGWSFINGYREEPPLQMPHGQAGYIGGVVGFIAAAAALRRRGCAARAELVDVSEMEALALTVHPWSIAAVYEDTGFAFGPGGGRYRGDPGPLWEAADGRMNFAIGDFRNWPEAMAVLNLPEMAGHPALIPDPGRHAQDLSPVVAGIAGTLPALKRWPVFHALTRLRCPVGVLQDIEDIVQDPQLAARDFLVTTEIAGQQVRAPGPPAQLSPAPWRLRRPAPQLDQHGAEVRAGRPALPLAPAVWQQSMPLEPAALAAGPLSGVRVLSFGQAWSGTFGAEVLALLGADVVQVGSLQRPDVWRRVRGTVPSGLRDAGRVQHPLNTQGLYNSVNLNKREIALDVSDPRGREILWRLLPRFDIVLDNFRPRVLPSWGITLETLHAMRPGMIWASISGYGESGPYREYPANGATTEPMSGFSSLLGYEGDRGKNSGGLYPDPVAGYFLVANILAALSHRDRTGAPQRIDLSMMEAVTTVCGDAVMEYDATGRLPGPTGNRHPRMAPHNNYRTADGGWLALAAESDAAWRGLVDCLDEPLLRAERFATMAARKAHEAELDVILAAWCAGRSAVDAEQRLARAGVTVALVANYYALYREPSPDFVSSGFVTLVDHPEAGPTWLPGRPWRFSAAASAPVRPAPCLGQHSREILVGELGIDSATYDALVEAGVTGTLHDMRRAGMDAAPPGQAAKA